MYLLKVQINILFCCFNKLEFPNFQIKALLLLKFTEHFIHSTGHFDQFYHAKSIILLSTHYLDFFYFPKLTEDRKARSKEERKAEKEKNDEIQVRNISFVSINLVHFN